jgi:hypothetical protein
MHLRHPHNLLVRQAATPARPAPAADRHAARQQAAVRATARRLVKQRAVRLPRPTIS